MKNFTLNGMVAALLVLFISTANANVTVTPATGGSCANIAPGAYKVLSNIVITEGAVSDFAVQSGATFILAAPAGFEFRAGTGSLTFTAGQDITSASVVVTPALVTVTLNVATNTKSDILRIRFLEIRSLVPYATGNIVRPVAGGTAVIAGNAAGAGVIHGRLTTTGTGALFVTAANGAWSNAATWAGGIVPSCNDNVSIGHTVTSDLAVGVNNLTISAGGNLVSDNAVTVGGNFVMNANATYTHNNITAANTTIFGGIENFDPASTINISRWYSNAVPFPTSVTGNFGNIIFNATGSWNQGGMFAPARIKGTLTISNGVITLDNGSGMTTALTLQDVVINSAGRLIVQSGTARDLTLNTNNFTDNSTVTGYTFIMSFSVGDLVWNVNGNLNVNHRFTMIEGAAVTDIGSAAVTVTGNFNVTGGIFNGFRNATGPISMTVNGTTSIANANSFTLKENYSGDVTFISGTMTVSTGSNNYLMRTNGTSGTVNATINGDLNISGATTRFYFANTTTNFNDVNVTVTNDINLTGGQLTMALTPGDVSVSVGRNYNQSGTAIFYGQRSAVGNGTTDIIVYGGLNITGGTFTQSSNLGTVTLNITESLSVQNATFYGMANSGPGNNGVTSLVCTDLDISGSTYFLHRGEITDGRTINVDIAGQMIVNFTNAAQQVYFVSKAGNNNARLDLTIEENLFVTGTADGIFCSSMSEGAELVTINGDVSISRGRVRFNAYEGSAARGHEVTGTVAGSVSISGGSLCLSSHRGTATWNIGGDYDQTGGYAVYKWNTGMVNITVQGNYNLANANATFYARQATANTLPVSLQINGDATFSACNVMFDSCLSSTATHRMIFSGDDVSYGDNVIFNHASHLTTGTVFGSIVYNRAGIMNVNRNSVNFDIRQVKQQISSATTVNFASSPFDLMVASHSSAVAATHTTLTIDGTLNMGTKMISARQQANYLSSAQVNSGGRLRTAHTNGLYSGTSTPACINAIIGAAANMNYFLHANSTVEYNGTDTQVLTGIGNGLATTVNHRYGNLEINFLGTPNVEFVAPNSDFVFVRTSLSLVAGELNLDTDHITNGGGHVLNIENGASVMRNNGYIRSETEDGSGAVSWSITSNGSFVFPFGYDAGEYVPFTYQAVAGNSGLVRLSTYHSAANNTPLPPTVTHVRDLVGIDNSNNTVDRFWRIDVPGNVTANVTFTVTNAERSGIMNMRAQLWEPVSAGWFPPTGIQSNPTITSTLASGLTGFNFWWTLSAANSPLPVELLSFDAYAEKKHVRLEWATASEINNDYFTVQRSANGIDFENIARITGAGNSTNMNEYHHIDASPLKGLSYYRLMQTDFDGASEFSEIRKVSFNQPGSVAVYPNPVSGMNINIETISRDEKVIVVNIYDLAGKLVNVQFPQQDEMNGNTTSIDISKGMPEGTYMVEINTTGGTYRERIIKL